MEIGFATNAITSIILLGRNAIAAKYKPENKINNFKRFTTTTYLKTTLYKRKISLLCLQLLLLTALPKKLNPKAQEKAKIRHNLRNYRWLLKNYKKIENCPVSVPSLSDITEIKTIQPKKYIIYNKELKWGPLLKLGNLGKYRPQILWWPFASLTK